MIELSFYLVLTFINGNTQLLGPYVAEKRCQAVMDAAIPQISTIKGAWCMKVRTEHSY